MTASSARDGAAVRVAAAAREDQGCVTSSPTGDGHETASSNAGPGPHTRGLLYRNPVREPRPVTERPPSQTQAPDPSLVQACDDFYEIIADFSLSDGQTAARLYALAEGKAAGTDIESILRTLGDLLRINAEEIRLEPIIDRCP